MEEKAPQEEFVEFNLPDLYFTGFHLRMNLNDVDIILMRRDVPVAILSAPHSTSKELVEKLGRLLERFEANSGQPIRNLDEIRAALEKSEENDDGS